MSDGTKVAIANFLKVKVDEMSPVAQVLGLPIESQFEKDNDLEAESMKHNLNGIADNLPTLTGDRFAKFNHILIRQVQVDLKLFFLLIFFILKISSCFIIYYIFLYFDILFMMSIFS
jgi:hypothetical protein